MQSLIQKLFEIGAVKFGDFQLKSGIRSPVYIDLRLVISSPKLLVAIAEALYESVKKRPFDLLCGVPYTALPFATAMSIEHTIPMVLCRKEKKEHGTGRRVEGIFTRNQKCVLVEDVITSGQSLWETWVPLAEEGLVVEDAVVLVDREQGGRKFLEQKGLKVHAVCTISQITAELQKEGKISSEIARSVKHFIQTHQMHA